MPDSQTALAALQAGEIDFYEIPPTDFMDQLEFDKNIKVEVLNKTGKSARSASTSCTRPSTTSKARQAMLHLVKQSDYMKATFGDRKYARTVQLLLRQRHADGERRDTGWFKEGQNFEKAKALLKEAGYDGRPIVLLQATNIPYMSNSAPGAGPGAAAGRRST